MLVVVAYDIANDRRRTRMHTLLSGYGESVQESVFECELEPGATTRMLRRIRTLVRPGDRVRLYPLCSGCAAQVIDGNGELRPAAPEIYVT